MMLGHPDFSICATILLARLEKHIAFIVDLTEQEREEFVMMSQMGFFTFTGQPTR